MTFRARLLFFAANTILGLVGLVLVADIVKRLVDPTVAGAALKREAVTPVEAPIRAPLLPRDRAYYQPITERDVFNPGVLRLRSLREDSAIAMTVTRRGKSLEISSGKQAQ